VAAALLFLAALVAVLALPTLRGGTAATPAVTPPPIPEGYTLALVAQIEHTGGQTRDVSGNILIDLKRRLEEEVPLSQIIVREYPQPIRSPEEGRFASPRKPGRRLSSGVAMTSAVWRLRLRRVR
jgi:hypothetical protein